MLNVLRQLLSFLDARSRLQLFALLLPMVFASFLEMLSIGLVIPLTHAALGDGLDQYSKWIPDVFDGYDENDLLIAAIVSFAILFIIKNMVIFAVIYQVTKFTKRKLSIFMQQAFDLYLRRPYTFHLRRNSAEIVRNLFNSAGASFDGLRVILNMTMDILLAMTAGMVLLFVEPMATIGIAIALLVAAGGFYKLIHRYVQNWGAQAFFIEGQVIKTINQGLGAIKDIKIANCHPDINKKFASLTDEHAQYSIWSNTANQSPRLFIETTVVLIFLTVLFFLFSSQGSVNDILPVVSLFGMAALRLMPAASRILSATTEIKHRTKMVSSLYNDMQEGQRELSKAIDSSVTGPVFFDRDIELRNVNFSYPDTNTAALENINLKIQKGSTIGLVGLSGSGKTTIANIVLGLLSPTKGSLLVDGYDVSSNISGWQQHLGYVPQDIYLLDDSLRRNVAFGVADSEIDDSAVIKALEMSQLSQFLRDLPEGLDTMLGEHGARFSGGQRQRVGIARALYRDPDFLVLDEATSALDSETEYELSQAIDVLARQKTLIIIAHRLSTVEKCDCLYFMKNGAVVDSGPFHDLATRSTGFRQLVERQQGGGFLDK